MTVVTRVAMFLINNANVQVRLFAAQFTTDCRGQLTGVSLRLCDRQVFVTCFLCGFVPSLSVVIKARFIPDFKRIWTSES